MEFYKYHGTGNDFVILDGTEKGPFLSPQEIAAACDRHTGIGADGVIFACASPGGADAAMRIFNADGSEAEMCGNGIRCLAKYLYERRGVRKDVMYVDTLAGAKQLRLSVRDGAVSAVEVDMGTPELASPDLPAPDHPERPGELSLEVEQGVTLSLFCLSMGNPHCVLWVEEVEEAPVASLGPRLETHPLFPRRVNVGFAQLVDAHRVKLRVWERGVGETLACGTGACAAAVSAINLGRCASPVEVRVRGGVLSVRVDEYGHVHMSGPAVEVYRGELSASWQVRPSGTEG